MRMRFRLGCLIAAALLLGLSAQTGWSQRSGTTSSGLFGNRSLGGFPQPGSRTLFGGSAGSPAGMGSGLGASSGRGGMAGAGTPGGTLTGSERFLRANRQGAFVGRDVQDVRQLIGALTGGRDAAAAQGQDGFSSGPQAGGGFRQRSAGGRGPQGIDSYQAGGAGGNRSQPTIRRAYRVAFDYPQPDRQQLSAALANRLERTLGWGANSGRQAVVQDRTVILRGSVASDYRRVLAEKLAALEPGIDRVENQLVVETTPAEPPTDSPR